MQRPRLRAGAVCSSAGAGAGGGAGGGGRGAGAGKGAPGGGKPGAAPGGKRQQTAAAMGVKLEPWEETWFGNIQNWGQPRRCKFYNATCGCPFGAQCQFVNLCFLCGEEHPAVAMHWPTDTVPWA